MKKNKIIIYLILFLIASCGYQIQRNIFISKDLQPIYIDGDRRLSLLLSKRLSINNIEITNSANSASSIIKINGKKQTYQAVTIDKGGLTNQYALTAECFFSWKSKDKNEYIIMPTKLTSRIIQLKDNNNILAQYSTREKLDQQLNIKLTEKATLLIKNK